MPAAAISSKTTRVLLLENDGLQRQLIREYLESEGGYRVVEVSGKASTLARLRQAVSKVDLVLMDVESSLECGDSLKTIRASRPGLPILGLTDHSLPAYRQTGLRRIWNAVLRKPFSSARLRDRIGRLVAQAAD